MTIFGRPITGSPNWQFYAVTAFFVYISYANWTPWPIIWWTVACAVMIPVSFALMKWNEGAEKRHAAAMLRDFPHDPAVQKKYGKPKE